MPSMPGFVDNFCGPDKTLTLRFKGSKIVARSLRFIDKQSWSAVLHEDIVGVVDSNIVDVSAAGKKHKKVNTSGITGYVFSESSLLVSDTTLTLKTSLSSPVDSIEQIFDLVVPGWQTKYPGQYLKFMSYSRPGDVLGRSSWPQEVEHLNKHLAGEATSLGTDDDVVHVYVDNYLSKDEISDMVLTEVSLSELDTASVAQRFCKERSKEFRDTWALLHGDEARSMTSRALFDEHFFNSTGYSANGVFGRHWTSIRSNPKSPNVSVETSLPLTREAKHHFVLGAENLCRAGRLRVFEFSLCPKLFSGERLRDVPGFTLDRTSQRVSGKFACALHHYSRLPTMSPTVAPQSPEMRVPHDLELSAAPFDFIDEQDVPKKAVDLYLESCQEETTDLPVHLLDLGSLHRKAEEWRSLLPRVEPFYAVKCNSHPAILETLWRIWKDWGKGGFDCASPSEIESVLGLGADPVEKIVYANPCKHISALEFARECGVKRLVFDNAAELDKIASIYPDAELTLRVQTDDSLAQCPLSNKFGVPVDGAGALLRKAVALGLKVVGVSFHVGSGCSQTGAFRSALQRAKAVFDEASRQGLSLTLLDIGGGFPGWDEDGEATFANHANDITPLLEELFPSPAIQVIAEPGRFFAATTQSLVATVIAVADSPQGQRCYLNDGVYGSFNCLVYDHASVPKPLIFRGGHELSEIAGGPLGQCTLFGPTCDGFDLLCDDMLLPTFQVGDKLLFKNMGAYTSSAATRFNGFEPAGTFIVKSRKRVA